MKAMIEWIPEEQGGRRRLPTGVGTPAYSPVVRFLGDPWPDEVAWSFGVVKVQSWDAPRRWLAEVGFRVDEAPVEQLREGAEFELYEGPQCVAHGRLLADGNPGIVAETGALVV